MKVKRLIVGAAVSSLAVVSAIALITNGNTEKPKRAAIATPTCASIHFGMNDATLTGYWTTFGETISKSGTEKSSLISSLVSGITLTSFKADKDSSNANGALLVAGGPYSIDKKDYTATNTHGLKLGTSSGHTDLIFKFGSNIVACDIYAVAWNETGVSIAANGEEAISLTKNASVAGTPTPDTTTITYTKCHFDFDSTDTLRIVTTKRLVIGDIALRLA